jgi:hypothetical protein
MNFLLGIKNILITAVVALFVGGLAGYWFANKLHDADELEKVVELRKEDANVANELQRKDGAVTDRIVQTNDSVSAIQKEVAKRVQQTTKPVATNNLENGNANCKPARQEVPEGSLCNCDAGLSIGIIRLLNDARTGAPFNPATINNEEGGTPSGLSLADILDNDLEVVKKYHELASRHNGCVDYVDGLVKDQRKRLNLE